MYRKILELFVSRNFQIAGTSRNSFSWKFYERVRNFSGRFKYSNPGSKKTFEPKVLFALATSFSFKEYGISDDRIRSAEKVHDEFDAHDDTKKGWEILREEKDFRALRRRLPGPKEIYEYKCAGTYWDISPQSFLDAQIDITYRTEWDGNILTLELLEEENEHELLRWVSKFPYPLHAREYIYVRRTWISEDRKIVVIESEVVSEDIIPSDPKSSNVRVATYTSRMAIRAHKEWNDNGVDYILTYSDNPEANIPRYIYNWMVNQGGPYFLKQVHKAALELQKSGREIISALDKMLPHKQVPLVEKTIVEENKENQKESFAPENLKEEDQPKKKEIIPGVNSKKHQTSSKLCV